MIQNISIYPCLLSINGSEWISPSKLKNISKMAESTSRPESKPRGSERNYHYSVLYNYFEGPASRRQGDHLLASKFFNNLTKELAQHGYDKVMYYEKAIGGSNVFETLSDLINKSEKLVVLLTPEFMKNRLHKFTEQTACRELIDQNITNIIPIGIGIERKEIPMDSGLSVSKVIYTDYTQEAGVWKADDGVWDQVRLAVGHRGESHGNYMTNDAVNSNSPRRPVQVVQGIVRTSATSEPSTEGASADTEPERWSYIS